LEKLGERANVVTRHLSETLLALLQTIRRLSLIRALARLLVFSRRGVELKVDDTRDDRVRPCSRSIFELLAAISGLKFRLGYETTRTFYIVRVSARPAVQASLSLCTF